MSLAACFWAMLSADSQSTPPTSPRSASPHAQTFSSRISNSGVSVKTNVDESTKKPTPIDSRLSLELRIRWLEVLLLGVKHDSWDRDAHASSDATPRQTRPDGESLVKRAEEVQKKLDKVVDANDGLKKFIDRCEWSSALPSCARPHLRSRRPTCRHSQPFLRVVWFDRASKLFVNVL